VAQLPAEISSPIGTVMPRTYDYSTGREGSNFDEELIQK